VVFADSLAKQAIERSGTYALGVETQLDSASIGLFSGEFELGRLRIANPPGYKQPDFFSLRLAKLELPLSALTKERIAVPLLSIEGVALDLERNERGTNYGVILDNLERFESGAPGKEGEQPEAGSTKVFVLERLVIRDVHASIDLLPEAGDATKVSLSIPEVVVENLGSEMTLGELCALVVKTILQAALEHGGGMIPPELMNDLRGRLDDLKSESQGKLEEAAQQLGSEAQEALQKAGDKLDSLFKKKN